MNFSRSMVLVSSDPESVRRGADEIYALFEKEIAARDMEGEISISRLTDTGRPDAAPIVVIYPEAVVYGPVNAENVKEIVEEHLYKGRVAEHLLAPTRELSGRIGWLKTRKGTLPAEKRIVLRRAGRIDPENIEEYIAEDGYQALAKALTGMKATEVIDVLKESGLQGRGGAGFPTGLKWSFVAGTQSEKKYVVCNADESEPGTFKDRVILEGDPLAIIEAMTIAGYAVGADEGFVYVRGEYKLAQNRLENAVKQAREYGLLGKNIMDTAFSFDIHIHSGAGAYICGEETALLESIEGKRGEPRSRPPYPTTEGLWGKPTLVNNVETLANVPPILLNGGQWYRQFGTPSSPGTKVYTILGNVNFTGLIEVPMGITLREVVNIYGQGMKDGATFKLAQTGGSSGSVIPASLQDTPMDFESFRKAGVSLGSGALLICDENTCVVDLALVLQKFFKFESCGKCTPCRVGTGRIHEILTGIVEGRGTLKDMENLDYLVDSLTRISNCGLGQTASVPINDVLKYFRPELEAHIKLGVCPCGVCPMSAPVKEPAAVA
ncbi:MAG: NADH-quinone oxidoreductase subunit NuoF [Anaerolineales bacterium]|nr:NADH-quinone oxidoreductase subunit NuoF [Anaerolineales bacterium]